MNYGPKPWQQSNWDFRAALNFIFGGAGAGLLTIAAFSGLGGFAEARELVWERFYRVLGSEQTGSGLGLSIVKRIADLHHANVTLAAGEHGKGLRVEVTFPVRD